jgi:hypothetical protein
MGRVVTEMNSGKQAPGKQYVTFSANNLASGVYYYRLRAGDFVDTKKMLLLK